MLFCISKLCYKNKYLSIAQVEIMKRLSETTALNNKDRRLLLELKKVVAGYALDATVLLYGSVARGTATIESDYDVIIITCRKLSRMEEDALDADIYMLQLEHNVVFSAMIISADDWESPLVKVSPYYKNVTRDAIAV